MVSPHNIPAMDSRETLRREGRRRRATVAAGENDSGPRLAERFLSSIPYREHKIVSGYWPVGGEIDDRPLLRALRAERLAVALPRVVAEGCPLQFRAWGDADDLEPGPYGIPVPLRSAAPLRPTLVIVPLVLFDGVGHRLGSGKGFYDRTLAELRGVSTILAVGVAYMAQRIEALPALPTDQRFDAVVTEAGVEWF